MLRTCYEPPGGTPGAARAGRTAISRRNASAQGHRSQNMESSWSGHHSNDVERPNHSIQRTRASRSAQFVFVAQWRLAPAADTEWLGRGIAWGVRDEDSVRMVGYPEIESDGDTSAHRQPICG
jgi:hypothetical protein